MKKYPVIILVFLMLFLTGCEIDLGEAMLGIEGISVIFLMSLLTLFFYTYFQNKKSKKWKENFITFVKENKLLFWILFSLVLFNVLLYPLIYIGDAIYSEHLQDKERYILEAIFGPYSIWGENFLVLIIVSVFLLVIASISTIIYSLLVISLLKRYTQEKYLFLTPIIITILYIITLFLVYLIDQGKSLYNPLLMLWIWPLFTFKFILRNLNLF